MHQKWQQEYNEIVNRSGSSSHLVIYKFVEEPFVSSGYTNI